MIYEKQYVLNSLTFNFIICKSFPTSEHNLTKQFRTPKSEYRIKFKSTQIKTDVSQLRQRFLGLAIHHSLKYQQVAFGAVDWICKKSCHFVWFWQQKIIYGHVLDCALKLLFGVNWWLFQISHLLYRLKRKETQYTSLSYTVVNVKRVRETAF